MAECVMEKVEDILTCSMCLGVLQDPKTFNCLHSYCRGCVEQLKTTTQDKVEGYECPQCRRFTPKKEVRLVHLIVQLLDAYYAAKNAPKASKCEQCRENEAVWRCLDCKEDGAICEPCKLAHDRFSRRFGTQHQVVAISELREAPPVLDKPLYCTEHADNKLEVFCKSCSKAICVLCKIFQHDSHEAEPVPDALRRLMPQIDASTAQIETSINGNQQTIETLKNKKKEIIKSSAEKQQELTKELEESIAKLRTEYNEKSEQVKAREREDLSECDKIIQQAENKITEQRQVVAWVQTTKARTKGVIMLHELQNGLLEKLEETASQAPLGLAEKQARLWPMKLVENNTVPRTGNKITLENNGRHQYTRVAVLWDMLWLFNHDTHKLYQYKFDGTRHAVIQPDGTIQKPRTAVQLDDMEAVLSSQTGLYAIQASGQVGRQIAAGDFADVCLASGGRLYALEHINGLVVCLQRGPAGLDRQCDIALQGYRQDNVKAAYNYVDTLTIHEDTVYVSMVYAHKIIKYCMSGKKLQMFDSNTTGLCHPSICGITANNSLLICDFGGYALEKMSPDGTFQNLIKTSHCPRHATYQSDSSFWVVMYTNTLQQYVYD